MRGLLENICRTTVIRAVDSLRLGTVSPVRSPRWRSVRARWLVTSTTCAACGAAVGLEVHHIKPFHQFPELELDRTNLITLCEAPGVKGCHLNLGHKLPGMVRGCWKVNNPFVAAAAARNLARVTHPLYGI